ncbi:protein adenylyltransferase SelO [Candidatus Uabimicrobium amorphum]|uniref:Protein nucleotidyltransferase YdiU n=1 Tax=Uabimicrobium amorphum TaxID=2596890 RepID=A0A5S9IVC5_UABAM|nr:YdiU family protein [Candidatus Uabimicrobium amorphum]BBM88276.1 UPF0061 protein [Candidatus Uabimicrobium amorphum]
MFEFDNTYTKLPSKFFANVNPLTVPQAKLIKFNETLAHELGKNGEYSSQQLAEIFAGQTILEGSQPIAMAYAGHQFGHFVPQLGDGRAILLGEVVAKNGVRYDIQLKGAGRTPFSRGGDGRCPLGPALREYIVSEAMHALGVPTTRALAIVTTGDFVYRNSKLPGAIFTRVAKSHIRVGTFEYFASRRNKDAIQQLADYAIARHYPKAQEHDNPYIAFFRSVAEAQISLVTTWMSLGFIHGVMNTDNTSISGETIDFGPCAFMDEFNFHKVFSSIDHQGRYAYANQAAIIMWNLSRLGDCLLELVHKDQKKAISILEEELEVAHNLLEKSFTQKIAAKLGIEDSCEEDHEMITAWLQYLQKQKYDYTISFRELTKLVNVSQNNFFENNVEFRDFLSMWRHRIKTQDANETQKKMQQVNPIFIPRNHQVERAISHAMQDDFSVFEELNKVLQKPYEEQPQFEEYQKAPREEQKVQATFCGT